MMMDREKYQQDGYFKKPQFLTDNELSALQAQSADFLDSEPCEQAGHDEPAIWCWRHRPDGKRSAFPLSASSVITAVAHDPERMAFYRELSGSDFLQLFEIVLFDKPPGIGEQFVWHSDRAYYPIEPGDSISVWIAIDDCDEENGTLQFAKGSHKIEGNVATRNVKTGELSGDGLVPEPEKLGLETERVDLAAGDAVFFAADTWHASAPNRSATRRRRGVVVRFWLNPARYRPAEGKSAAFVRQITAPPGEIIEGPCFPVVSAPGRSI